MKKLIFILYCTLLSSCAQDLYIKYQSETTNPGKIVIQPEKPTERTFVTIDDSLIVDKKLVRSLTIDNIPEGTHSIHYSTEFRGYKEQIDSMMSVHISNQEEITKSLKAPRQKAGSWIWPSIVFLIGLGMFTTTIGNL